MAFSLFVNCSNPFRNAIKQFRLTIVSFEDNRKQTWFFQKVSFDRREREREQNRVCLCKNKKPESDSICIYF
jgi:hypothetical protein